MTPNFEGLRSDFYQSEQGASLVNYVLLISLIAVVALIAVNSLGTNSRERFCNIAGRVGQDNSNYGWTGSGCGLVGGWP